MQRKTEKSANRAAPTHRPFFSPAQAFVPLCWLRNSHLQTLATALPRRFPPLPKAERRRVEVKPDSRLLLECNWQRDRRCSPTLLLLHGLEGSARSHYMLGTAEKAYRVGFNAVRMNLRNCGGTEALTPLLYNAGVSEDLHRVVDHLLDTESLPEVHLAAYSLGANVMLKLAGEWGTAAPVQVRSVAVVSPPIELGLAADRLEEPANFLYQIHFLQSLKARLRRKARLFPQRYSTDELERAHTVREFDDLYTAPHGGYGNAASYYHRAASLRVIENIQIPTLVITAQDDPLIPFEPFQDAKLTGNPNITLLAPRHGGHGGFIGRRSNREDHFWAENRLVEFARCHSEAIG